MEYLKKIYALSFIVLWIYFIYYPTIDKVLKLNSGFQHSLNKTCNLIIFSSLPGINTYILIVMIREDIELYLNRKG